MMAKPRVRWLPLLLLALSLLVVAPRPTPAQYFGDDLEQQFFEDEDDLFREDRGGPGGGGEFVEGQPDFTEGGEFVEEGGVGAPGSGTVDGATLESRQAQLRTAADRETLPLNTAWGAGTGLLLGGWFAFINNGTSRETQRSIGTGVVLGTIAGALVGMRTALNPETPRAAQSAAPTVEELRARAGSPVGQRPTPLVAVRSAPPLQFSFRLRF